MIEIKGKASIVAKIICDSISEAGVRLITFELQYPRIIHADLMTHRQFSRNAASSRAIPFAKMLKQLEGIPARFGKNQSGMQDCGYEHDANVDGDTWDTSSMLDVTEQLTPQEAWYRAREDAIKWAERFNAAGYHKQITGRLTEPFMTMKTVVTATEWDNWFWLRNDDAADPTIAELAQCMAVAVSQSKSVLLMAGEYHLPYVDTYLYCDGTPGVWYGIFDENDQIIEISLEDAIKVSCARCAAVSYKNEGYGLEKSVQMYERLVGSDKKHSSALEHCATPMRQATYTNLCMGSCYGFDSEYDWEEGISHMDRAGNLWSGNFKGWVQHRKTIDGECYTGDENA